MPKLVIVLNGATSGRMQESIMILQPCFNSKKVRDLKAYFQRLIEAYEKIAPENLSMEILHRQMRMFQSPAE